ncbi:hypothetical protein SMACR_12748 [Sordaria macrospora]|uniref:WGS project CABT00000000 data, contig 2.23 n=2 Tax=Sordaria macrospora TaxID=5147 RepID=F7W346_SORMK|nr:uncharacterized protein SMAC_12748 [Sordaria macrospora k-hell]KAA8628901.1 hypothetical protein SMACR_12748 [Sordaria macrospora]WPJ63630.1 hypothetical protein SMAC4_12748 [Sordaria macrospora]CCC12048.1 unnamed protein product [Sordaria macrospora k-hell]
MAGDLEHYKLAQDPAFVRLSNMTSNRYKYFRWTPRTARITLTYMVVVPAIVGYVAYKSDGKYNFRAKRKGDDMREF